jgi:hypothetical protein
MLKTKVLYWWAGKINVGNFVGYKNKNFLVEHPHYDNPVETKIIYPYIAKYVGLFWSDIPELKDALIAFGRD